MIIFQQKKKLFYHQRTKKKHVLLEKLKAKFFVTTLKWYKYNTLLTVVYIILNEVIKKNKTFDMGCIVK